MKRKKLAWAAFALFAIAGLACGVNSVTKDQLAAVKPGDVLVYRFQKDGKSWFYADKITRIDGDIIYFTPSENEGTSGKDERIKTFGTKESSMTKLDLLNFDTEQGPQKKVVIWINP